jgi:hypothetical protein
MAIHVQRRHKGMDNLFILPSNSGSDVARLVAPHNGNYPWSNNHHKISEYHNKKNNKSSYAHTLAEDFNLSKEAMTSKEQDLRNSLIEDIYQAIKIRNLINQTRPISQPSAPDLTSLLMSSTLSRNFDPGMLLLLLTIIKSKNIGFRGNICSNCFTWWIIPLSNNEAETKSLIYTKSYHHICESENLVEAAKVQDPGIKKNELENQLVTQLLSLTYVCATLQNKKPYLGTRELIYPPDYSINHLRTQSINDFHDNLDQKPYLRYWVEGEEVNCNSVDIALPLVNEKHWAKRAIGECLKSGESSFELNINELIDFLKAAKGTLGVLTTDIGESISSFLMSISFKSK